MTLDVVSRNYSRKEKNGMHTQTNKLRQECITSNIHCRHYLDLDKHLTIWTFNLHVNQSNLVCNRMINFKKENRSVNIITTKVRKSSVGTEKVTLTVCGFKTDDLWELVTFVYGTVWRGGVDYGRRIKVDLLYLEIYIIYINNWECIVVIT